MAPSSSIQPITPSTSSSPSQSSNFSGNQHWIPPNFSHSIFSTQVVDRTVFKFDSWIIDTGATDHMVHSVSQFTTITSIVNTYVYLPNGDQALVTHVGTVHISSTLVLKDELCIPSFGFNLISVSKLTKTLFCCLIFFGNCCFIQDLAQWSMIGQGRESNGLYLLDSSHQQRSTALSATSTNPFSSTELWHNRLGHPSFSKLQLLKGVVNIDVSNKTTCCDVCHFSKQKRLPFPISTHISSAPFDLIHCDLWGPFATCTIEGYKYFLTIVDDFSRCTWVYLLKLKSDTQFVIPNFANMVKTQFNISIKTIRSDNGTEFYLKDFFHSNGILHQLTCVDTPQQNAIVERKHQHILNVARALKFQSHVPLCFWGDCILTAVHLINRVPSKSLGNKTPYEMLFHSPPSYTHLRCFGCLCFISTSSSHRHKFAPRSRKCVFLGYPHGIKGYKVLDLATNSVYISRDIVFYESNFPYASTSSPSNSYLTDFVFPHVNSSSSCTSDCLSSTTPTHSFPDSIPISDSDLVISHSESVASEPTPHTSLVLFLTPIL